MKILVCVKRVIDFNVHVRVKADGSGVDLAGVKMAMNPFDEIAVEEAVRLKERGIATEVVVLSIGPDVVQEQLRTALAMGADYAVHVKADTVVQPLAAAKIIAAVVKQEQPEMVLMGKQAIDDDCGQTGQMLAAMLGWSQGTFAAKVEILLPLPLGEGRGEGGAPSAVSTYVASPSPDPLPKGEGFSYATVTRETDGGPTTLRLNLPAVITADLRLNTPRYPTLPNIMKAKSKPLKTIPQAELNLDVAPRIKVLKVEEPARRKAGQRVKDVAELVDKLKNEAKVL